jgi:thioredoxin
MKKITLFTAIFFLFFSCGNSQKTEQQTDSSKKNNKEMSTIHLTTAEFKAKVFDYDTNTKWKYAGDKPCLIDFYADWCAPCRMVAPILEELAKEYESELYIYKIDTEAEQELAAAFGIRSIPSLLFVPMDGQPQMVSGAMGKADLKQAIGEVLLK